MNIMPNTCILFPQFRNSANIWDTLKLLFQISTCVSSCDAEYSFLLVACKHSSPAEFDNIKNSDLKAKKKKNKKIGDDDMKTKKLRFSRLFEELWYRQHHNSLPF